MEQSPAVETTDQTKPFDGRYRIVGRVGVGGMAAVYLAEDLTLGRNVALKVLADRYRGDGAFIERFRREAQSAARLNHPNIIAIYDRGEADGRPYIAMEFSDGRTLKQLIVEEGALHADHACEVALQVLAALRFAHQHGVVHRDIKPHNVLIGRDGRVKVADFGIAHGGDPQMTEVGSIVGTAQYLSPEQARGLQVGPQSDLYSLGVVLYEMLCAQVPFEGDSSVAIAMRHVSEEPIPLRQRDPAIPAALEQIVQHAMRKDPALRYANADAFVADLEGFKHGRAPATAVAATEVLRVSDATEIQRPPIDRTQVLPPVPLPTPRPALPEPIPPQRRPLWPWLAVLLLVLAIGAVAAFALNLGGGDSGQATTDSTEQTTILPHVIGRNEVIGQTVDAIKRTYGRDTYHYLVKRVPDPAYSAGRVARTDPAPGDTINAGDDLTLFVSKGQDTLVDVSGKTVAEATTLLAGFVVKTKDAASDTVAKGSVISQVPAALTSQPIGSTVTLSVSTGKDLVEIPDVTGLDPATAAGKLQEQGLLGSEKKGCSDATDRGLVADQAPDAPKQVVKGSGVIYTVSVGVCRIPTDGLIGEQVATVVTILTDGGIAVTTAQAPTDVESDGGLVKSISPLPGARPGPGRSATVTVWTYAGSGSTTTDTTATTP